MTTNPPLTKKDFMSDQLIRWCPGCGDYSILSQTQQVMADLGVARHNVAVVSGIGCSSRFPYYMSTYGFHTIHGRGPAFATGLKCTRPDLSVWLITGDGDCLSIGGNHIIHLMRRNPDIQVMMFDNRIYGLTKGQYSPTSEVGKRTKSTPMGSLDAPFNPLALMLGAGASFVARSVDVFPQHLRETIKAAAQHKGTSFLQVYQNCNIFNDGAFADFTERDARDDRVLYLENGKPLVWGTDQKKWGIVLEGLRLKVVEFTGSEPIVVHDTSNRVLAQFLAEMDPKKGYPVAVGVFFQELRPCYDDQFRVQADEAVNKYGPADIEKLVYSGDTWVVGG